MEMNRDNYEMFFLLYTDNELDAAEKKAVEAFVALHADLKEELNTLLQTRLSASETIPFLHKESLFKTAGAPALIHEDNDEEYFILYADGELNAEEQKAVESYIERHPQKKAALLLLQRAKLQPDHAIIFPGKAGLYRTGETTARVIPFRWRRMVAAASVIATGGWLWMNAGNMMPQQAAEQRRTAKTPLPVQTEARQNKTTIPPVKEPAAEQLATFNKVDTAAENLASTDNLPKAAAHSLTAVPHAPVPPNSSGAIEAARTTVDQAPALPDEITPLVAAAPPAPETKRVIHHPAPVREEVKPLILDQAAFNGENEDVQHAAITKNTEGIAYWDTDNTEKRSKGKFRGLLRRASRLVDHVTNPDTDDQQTIVRVASFEITRK
ncbi:MAG TPA: hypothetical protein PLL71_10270 [Agriterribacter sp.]|mgnify:CR=1 FL=1|nr:hypothetical protein [Agriterribacter sp.]